MAAKALVVHFLQVRVIGPDRGDQWRRVFPGRLALNDVSSGDKVGKLCDREPVKNWTDRHGALLGDAAHPMLQYLNLDAGQAIEDAVVSREALRFTRANIKTAFQ